MCDEVPTARSGRLLAAASPRAAVLALAILASCGGAGAHGDPSFQVRGAAVVVGSTAPFTLEGDFPARLESTLATALRYWEGSWSDLEGVSITFVDDQYVPCEGHSEAIGCYENGEISVSTHDFGVTLRCVEETALVHEVGHVIIGDPDHTDPRWMDFASVVRDLAGREGYDASGDAPCDIAVNLWRHPPGSP
jgi:hypothetical protein